ncbi:hypothetical protein VTK26DRAFT_3281 [Humicola hyalothermophila]
MMRARPIQTTKWGTACAQCAAAKAKCSGRSSTPGSKCDRCQRLLKQCTDQVQKPRRIRQSRQPQSQSQHLDTGSPSYEGGAIEPVVSTPEYPSSPSVAEHGMDISSGGNPLYTSAHPLSRTPNTAIQSMLEGRDEEDEALLSRYRNELLPLHPFVPVPRQIPASTLRGRHPFLMLAIKIIANFEDLRTTRARMHHLTGLIADRIFRYAERSLDLLMAIIVILGWQHYHCAKHSQLNNLLCLAESLLSDLGLNKRTLGAQGENDEDGRSLQGKRLLLGAWYMRSSVAMHLQQLTSIPFTSYMRQCLAEIQESKEHDLDPLLVYSVKVQYLAERVAVLKTSQQRTAELSIDRSVPDSTEMGREDQERGAALASCRAYLDRLARELPGVLKDNAILTMQFNTVALRLSESRGSDLSIAPSPADYPFSCNPPNIETLLQTAAAPIRVWFQSWIAGMPSSAYSALPSHAVLQLLYALRAAVHGSSAGQANLQHQVPQYEGLTSNIASAARGISLPPSSQSGPNAAENAVIILNRLIALGPTGPDFDKFWAAIGERCEDECVKAISGSVADSISESSEGVPSPITQSQYQPWPSATHASGLLHHPIPSPAGSLISRYTMLDNQPSQPSYYSTMFIPPSRVASVSPGLGEYSGAPLMPTLSQGQAPPSLADQWTAACQWEPGLSPWAAASGQTHTGRPEDMNPELWLPDASQGS